jgi:hypothetical protein
MAEQNRPKAVSREGKIGDVSCYVLDDGRAVLTKRSTIRALQGGEHGTTNLDQYVERLQRKTGPIAVSTAFEFELPGGGIAEAIDDESFANIVQAYVDGLVLGKLHPQQVPIAQRAYELQKTWAKIGLRAHIMTATGVEPEGAIARLRSYAERLFRREPRDWERRFSHEFCEAVCGVYGWKMNGRRIPQQMSAVFDKLYRLILGNDGKAALKARNPNPHHGSNHHQHLADELDRELPTLTRAIVYIAHRSGHNIEMFWSQVEELLGVHPVQMLLVE